MNFTIIALAIVGFITLITAIFVGPHLIAFVNYGTPVPSENIEFVVIFSILTVPAGILGGLMMRDLMD